MFSINSEKIIISESNLNVFLELSTQTVRDILKRYLYMYVGILVGKIVDETAEFVHLGNQYELHEIQRSEDGQKVFDEEFSQDVESTMFIEDMVQYANIIVLSLVKFIDQVEQEKNLFSITEIKEVNLEGIDIAVQQRELSLVTEKIRFDLRVPRSNLDSAIGKAFWEEFGKFKIDPNDLFAHLGVALNNLSADIVDLYPRITRYAIVSPTGSGKTSMEARIAKVALKYFSVVVVSPYIGLLLQNSMEFGIADSAYLYTNEKTPIHPEMENSVIFTTINSLSVLISKLNEAKKEYMLILDEVHFFLQRRAYLLDLFSDKLTIGFTGTDGRSRRLSDLGFHYSHYSLLQEGIASGYLAPVRIYRYISRVSEYTSGLLKKYEDENALFDEAVVYQFAKDDIYAKSIAHAFLKHSIIYSDIGEVIGIRPTVIEAFSIMQASEIIFPIIQSILPTHLKSKVGILVSDNAITGNVTKFLNKLKNGEIDIVIHVNMLGVGINVPRLEVILLRPRVRSETKTEQSIGRVIRAYSNTIKTVVEIFPESKYSPEDMGFVTAKQIFGIKILLNGLIFRGDITEYERQSKVSRLQEYFKRKHNLLSGIRLNGDPCILVDEHYIHKDNERGGIKLGRINSVEGLSDFFCERILMFQALQLQSVYSYKQISIGSVLIPVIPQKAFERIFGFQKYDCAGKFFGNEITKIDKFLYDLCTLNESILNPYQVLECFSSFRDFVDRNITPTFGLEAVFKNLNEYFSAPIIRKYCEYWISKGELHPDYLARVEQTKLFEILRLEIEIRNLKFPFVLPSIDFSASPHQIVLDIEESIVEYMTREYLSAGANKMVRSLPPGYYFRDFENGEEKLFKFMNWIYQNTSKVRFEKLQQKYYHDSRVFLRELHRQVSVRCGEESWIDKPVDQEYIKRMVIKNYLDGKQSLTELSDISVTVFNSVLRQFGLSPVEYINSCLATVDEDFAISNRIYQNERYETFLSSLEQWAKASVQWRGKNIDSINTTNLHEYLPLMCTVSSKSTEIKSLTRSKVREFARRQGITTAKLISDIKEVLGRVEVG